MTLARCALGLAAVAALACSRAPTSPPGGAPFEPVGAADGGQQHLLMTVEVGPDGSRVLDARTVAMPLPRSVPAGAGAWRVEVAKAGGETLFSAEVPPGDAVRGEFAEADGGLSRVDVRRPTGVVALRLPVLSEARTVRLSAPVTSLPADDPRLRTAAREPSGAGEARALLGEVPYPAGKP